MKIAFVFPGQGSQYTGMGKALVERFPVAKKTYQEADAALGFGLSELILQGPEEELQRTENTQPALLATSIAYHRVLVEKGWRADFVAGHSLGEYSALVAAEALSFADACRLVKCRGRFMQEAVPQGLGAMAALIGADLDKAHDLIAAVKQARSGVLAIAGCNSPGQIVLSGARESVEEACRMARDFGVRKATLLKVSAPFHSPLMKPAEERMVHELSKITFQDPKIPYLANVTAKANAKSSEIVSLLLQQICHPVLWQQSVAELCKHEVRQFVEVGAGNVLSGLVKRCLSPELQAQILTADCESDLAALGNA